MTRTRRWTPLSHTSRRWLAAVLLFVVAPMVAVSILVYRAARQTMVGQAEATLKVLADSLEAQLLQLLDGKKQRAIDFASDGFIRAAIQGQSSEELASHLRRVKLPVDRDLRDIQVLDPSGAVVASAAGEPLLLPLKPHPPKGVRLHDIGALGEARSFGVCAPITDERSIAIGTLVLVVDGAALDRLLSGTLASTLGAPTVHGGLGRSAELYLVNDRARIIAGPKKLVGRAARWAPVVETLSDGLEFTGSYVSEVGEPMLAATMHLSEPGWVVVAALPERQILAPLRSFGAVALVYVGIGTALVSAAALFLSRRLTRPLTRVTSAAERIAAGRFSERVEASGLYGEAVRLASSFNAMLDVLQSSFEDLERSRGFNEGVIAAMPCGLMALDPTGRVQLVNRRLVEILGGSTGSWVGRPAMQALSEAGFSPADAEALCRAAGIAPLHAELPAAGDQEPRAIAATGASLLDGGHLVVMDDVTERRKVERMKREFVSVVSHELRTPLTSILGSLGLIAGGLAGELPAKARGLVEIAKGNADRLVWLINDILDMERIEAGKMELHPRALPVVGFLRQALEASRGFADRLDVSLRLREAPKDATVLADPDRLLQVMANLLSNAAKFAHAGSDVEAWAERRNGRIRIAVRDIGDPIPAEFRPRIFQKFAQADASDSRRKGGTGLGLSISKAIVERHGGTMGFESDERGTTFFFDLEAVEAPALAAGEVQGPKVLVCEDDPDVAALIRLMLESGGFCADVAHDAATARARLAESAYAAMTLDLRLPDEDGIELLKELREGDAARGLPVVVVSVKAAEGRLMPDTAALEVADWIDKPIDRDRLLQAVRHALRGPRDRRPRVLHVEDDRDLRHVVGLMLEGEAEVVAVERLQDAREALRRQPFDAVLLDVLLPDGSGLELIPELSVLGHGHVPVVVFSVKELDREASRSVMRALVKARTSRDELLDAIRAAVGRPRQTMEAVA